MNRNGQSKMVIGYLSGLIVLAFVYTLFWACWYDSSTTQLKHADRESRPQTAYQSEPSDRVAVVDESRANPRADHRDDQASERGPESPANTWYGGDPFARVAAIATALAFGVYVTQAILMYYTLQTNRQATTAAMEAIEQTDIVIDRMDRDQRPWLSVHNPMLLPLKLYESPTVQFEIRNTGKTPGTIVSTSFHPYFVFRETGKDINKDIDAGVGDPRSSVKAEDRQTAIAPGDTMPLEKVHPDWLQSDLFLLSFNNGGIVIVFAGKVEYTDVSDVIHETHICYVYDVGAAKFKKFHKHNWMK
jgi:hypothetical protein